MSITAYRCRACGAELFLTKRDAAEHLIQCDQADPALRRLAQEWIDAGCLVMQPPKRGGQGRRPAVAQQPQGE